MLSILSTRNKTAWDDYRLIYKTISALNIIFKKAREGQKIASNYYKISHHTIYGTFERIVIYCISFLGSILPTQTHIRFATTTESTRTTDLKILRLLKISWLQVLCLNTSQANYSYFVFHFIYGRLYRLDVSYEGKNPWIKESFFKGNDKALKFLGHPLSASRALFWLDLKRCFELFELLYLALHSLIYLIT